MITTVESTLCFVCEKKFDKNIRKQQHHTIPNNISPKNNIIVPICPRCHERINVDDTASLTAFAYKLHKGAGMLITQTSSLIALVELRRDNSEMSKLNKLMSKIKEGDNILYDNEYGAFNIIRLTESGKKE